MMMIVWMLFAVGVGLWFGRRLGPALVAAVVIMAVPFWLIGGFILDMLRKLIDLVTGHKDKKPANTEK